jgi:molybdopterin converting factor subunit 1
MSSCKILFFASLKDRAGVRQSTLELPDGITVGELKVILQEHFPSIAAVLLNALIAVNREYALDDTLIPPEAEIALFPPVSGG